MRIGLLPTDKIAVYVQDSNMLFSSFVVMASHVEHVKQLLDKIKFSSQIERKTLSKALSNKEVKLLYEVCLNLVHDHLKVHNPAWASARGGAGEQLPPPGFSIKVYLGEHFFSTAASCS